MYVCIYVHEYIQTVFLHDVLTYFCALFETHKNLLGLRSNCPMRLCVCLCVCMYVCVCKRVHVCLCMRLCGICVGVCLRECVYVRERKRERDRMCVYVSAVYVCACACMCVCACVRMHVCLSIRKRERENACVFVCKQVIFRVKTEKSFLINMPIQATDKYTSSTHLHAHAHIKIEQSWNVKPYGLRLAPPPKHSRCILSPVTLPISKHTVFPV